MRPGPNRTLGKTNHIKYSCFKVVLRVQEFFPFMLRRLCQLDAVRERSDGIYDHLFFNLTRYGDHSLHHLFPTVCHSKLPYLRPALLETLGKFKETLLTFPEWQLFVGTFQQLQRTQPAPFKRLSEK